MMLVGPAVEVELLLLVLAELLEEAERAVLLVVDVAMDVDEELVVTRCARRHAYKTEANATI